MTDEAKKILLQNMKDFAEALTLYQGNEITRYTRFSNLMVEEKINILADSIVLLFVKEIEELGK